VNESDLVNRAQDGDTLAFKELVERHQGRVAATVYGMLGACPEAEDVGQETFIRFYRRIKHFRGESSVGTYLTRIAINLSLNELKRRKRTEMWNKALHLGIDRAAEHDTGENREIVNRALDQLEPRFRAVAVLRLIDGYSTKETAEILGLPLGTVLSRLARAQNKLKKILAPHFGVKDGQKESQPALSII
jgi:RNA polymerase sigma-70 factor (ECF subfamily)